MKKKKIINKQQGNQQKGENLQAVSDQLTTLSFLLTVALVFFFTCSLYLMFKKLYASGALALPEPYSFPSFLEIKQNIQLLFQGYWGGYGRAIIGWSVFGMMSMFFLSAGKVVLDLIFRVRGSTPSGSPFDKGGNKGLEIGMNFAEWISLYYILGSLIASLLWFALGSMGLLNIQTAVVVGIAGMVLFAAQMKDVRYEMWDKIKVGYSHLSLTEKVLLGILVGYMLLFSATAVYPPLQGDTLATHVSLPSYYIYTAGKVTTYLYHFHSYFPQNTEMLIMWALLLNSEFAASLLIWGFLVAFALLVYGFLKRYTNNLTALLAVCILVTVPAMTNSVYIKNDIPTYLFLFAQYYALVEMINRAERDEESRVWGLLLGLFCGGAIGHKLTSMVPVAVSGLTILGYDCYSRKMQKKARWLIVYWLIGMAISICPWFMRTYVVTGNPVYPFLGKIFGSKVGEVGFFDTAEKQFGYNVDGMVSLKGWVSSHLGVSGHMPFSWGPAVIFGMLSPLVLRKRYSLGLRMGMIGAIVSCMLMFKVSVAVRYFTGMMAFIMLAAFAMNFASMLRGKWPKAYKFLALSVILFCSYETYAKVCMWYSLGSSLAKLMSGYSPDNFPRKPGVEFEMYHLRWMSHIINTRTKKDETFLYAAINYPYGLKRKAYFSTAHDKQIIFEVAKKSADSTEFRENLRKMGIDHILIKGRFFTDQFKSDVWSHLPIQESEKQKVWELLNKEMEPRFQTPSDGILWYSFKGDKRSTPIILGAQDTLEFPFMFIEQANYEGIKGNMDIALRMLEIACGVPMSVEHRARAYRNLGRTYLHKGDFSKAEELITSAIKILPNSRAYTDLGYVYENQGKFSDAIAQYEKAIEFDPKFSDAYECLGNMYLSRQEYSRALEYYKKVIELEPNNLDVYSSLGDISYSLKDYPKALQFYQKAIDIKPNFAPAYYNIGVIYDAQMQYDKAIQFFQKAVELDSNYVRAYKGLAYIYAKQKKYEKAQEMYRKATSLK